MAVEVDEQVAERLIGHTLVGGRLDVARAKVLRLAITSFEHQLANSGNPLGSLGIVVVVGIACPNGLLVELQMFLQRVAKHHGSQSAIAKGKGFGPKHGRTVVPHQIMVLEWQTLCLACCDDGEQGQGQEKEG